MAHMYKKDVLQCNSFTRCALNQGMCEEPVIRNTDLIHFLITQPVLDAHGHRKGG